MSLRDDLDAWCEDLKARPALAPPAPIHVSWEMKDYLLWDAPDEVLDAFPSHVVWEVRDFRRAKEEAGEYPRAEEGALARRLRDSGPPSKEKGTKRMPPGRG